MIAAAANPCVAIHASLSQFVGRTVNHSCVRSIEVILVNVTVSVQSTPPSGSGTAIKLLAKVIISSLST